MSLMVIEKSSGNNMACHKDKEKAIWQALKHGVARTDMEFVAGDVDVRIFRIAKIFVGAYAWLPQFLYEKGKGKELIDLAMRRLNVWQQIMVSRVVDDPEKYSTSLTVLFGQQLANEINLILDFYGNLQRGAFAPLTQLRNEDAMQRGIYLASRYRYKQYLLAVHDELGVYAVGPSELITPHIGFSIKRIFVREKV